ncbi:hypothetical protein [Chitinophaga alhagiae]|uniref:hypothetical protein n=1 Tax=Chitinophaga alhagiae TaxID=2203219 RepID=UPI000E5AAB56|nr:hypothetical protein [Chitinophaga alhagiae]
MKSFEELDNVDIGYYLHCWFPQHIPGLLQYLENMALSMRDERSSKQPDIEGVAADEMEELWAKIVRRIQHEPELKDNPTRFAERLFAGKVGILNVSCIITWINFIKHVNPKFTEAVKFFFVNA